MSEKKEPVVDEEMGMTQDLIDSMKSITEMTEDAIRQMPEHIFRTTYLPLLLGEIADGNMRLWADAAGGAYNEVEIVKDGKVIFTVPPLMRRHPTRVKHKQEDSIATIAGEAQLHMNNHPLMGQRMLVNKISKKNILQGYDEKSVAQFNAILKYYDRPLIGDVVDDEGNVTKRAEDDQKIDMGDDMYEDF